jgi:hypothetical protein
LMAEFAYAEVEWLRHPVSANPGKCNFSGLRATNS